MPRIVAILALVPLAACGQNDGDHAAAKALIATRCASCHSVPGVATARGMVGPPLAGIGKRATLAGTLPNTPGNMRRFLQHPREVVPNGAMPDLGLTPAQTAILTDYLETLDKP